MNEMTDDEKRQYAKELRQKSEEATKSELPARAKFYLDKAMGIEAQIDKNA